ncbi:hypothetical protein Sjap_022187 [Stephania japonica]|uniref:Uncharacterized protein n=1 Tax=Stephania japonica TaxID=461633 RepID=A0AAP0HUT1_9MAGN
MKLGQGFQEFLSKIDAKGSCNDFNDGFKLVSRSLHGWDRLGTRRREPWSQNPRYSRSAQGAASGRSRICVGSQVVDSVWQPDRLGTLRVLWVSPPIANAHNAPHGAQGSDALFFIPWLAPSWVNTNNVNQNVQGKEFLDVTPWRITLNNATYDILPVSS